MTRGVLVAVLMLAAGCSGSSSGDPRPASTVRRSTTSTTLAGVGGTQTGIDETGTPVEFKLARVADPVRGTDLFGTVTKADRIIGVQFQVTNRGRRQYKGAPFLTVRLQDAAGQSFEAADGVTDLNVGELLPGTLHLAAGESALGFVPFVLPRRSVPAFVTFEVSMLGGTRLRWSLGS